MNPNKPRDLTRLQDAVRASRRKLEPFRRRHKKAVEEYVGAFYSDDGSEKPVHLNLMELATNVYERHLAARPPRVTVFTRNKNQKHLGEKLESLMNDRLKDYSIYHVLRQTVRSALYSIGISKVGTRFVEELEQDGYKFSRTEPYVAQVLLDDWVHDMTARLMPEVNYCGHRYSMPLEEAKKFKGFKKSVRESLVTDHESKFNESGDERISSISQGYGGDEANLYDMVELWEVWLPREKLLVTYCDRQMDDKPLRSVEWDGPERHLGPFKMLWFNEVDGQTMPLAPAMMWQGLHGIVNGLYRKLEKQAQRVKHFGVTRGEDTEDAERIRQTSDGEVVAVQNPDAIQPKVMGGIDQSNFAFMIQSKNLFSWLAGNLDSLGGLSPQADTLGQDQMLFAAANQRVAGMQDRVMIYAKEIMTDFAYYLWQDPMESYPIQLEEQGLPPLETTLDPEEREQTSYFDHEVDVEPYSMQFQSPGQRLGMINQLVSTVIMPGLPLLQQQGKHLDMDALLKLYSKYANLPELEDLVVTQEEQVSQEAAGLQGGGEEGGGGAMPPNRQSPVTHRESVRTNRAATTRQGEDDRLIQQLLGGGQGNPMQMSPGQGGNYG